MKLRVAAISTWDENEERKEEEDDDENEENEPPIVQMLSRCLMYSPDSNLLALQQQQDQYSVCAEMFETNRAKLAAIGLWLGATCMVGMYALYVSQSWMERLAVVGFYLSSYTIPHVWLGGNGKRTWSQSMGFSLNLVLMLAQPHMKLCRVHSYVGAVHGSASVFHALRAMQIYLSPKEFAQWKPWRRMFFVSAWGWHDLRKVKFVRGRQVQWRKMTTELIELSKWAGVLALSVWMLKIWGSRPPTNGGTISQLMYFAVRWSVGCVTLVAWFNVMDACPRALHLWSNGHELDHISSTPWQSNTIKEFWRRWNVPVQELLLHGVYLPVQHALAWPRKRLVGRGLVFLVSALGHTYAISCAGLPTRYLVGMFFFFIVQVPVLMVEELLGLRGGLWMILAELPFAPMFIEPCLKFVRL
ncbi:hypothetical protein BASA81_009828 [Batrachochytrium salamandrivorans]|nr:hypothetical protein BASA81_009828 [Batrachochytrium salamandrivorans]